MYIRFGDKGSFNDKYFILYAYIYMASNMAIKIIPLNIVDRQIWRLPINTPEEVRSQWALDVQAKMTI